ncbi:hypothetical protein [Nocardia sp. NPDC057030]|uniref:hypothetical protein n=1 Tax=unclassified Nocardia TaxID=2637762 RepID=UPI00363E8E7B
MVFESTTAAPVPASPGNALRAVVRRRWPTLLGLAMVLGFAVAAPDASWIGVLVLILAALAYPAFGLYRRHLHGSRVLLVQAAALFGFLGLATVLLFVEGTAGRLLLAAGFLAHAAWDFAHHRADLMVPRWYAEFCAVVDVLVAAALVLGVVTAG